MRSEPVVMVHGWGGSFLRTWQEPGWEALLADAGRAVIGVDLLGHGTAEKPHDPEAYTDLTPAITAALPDGPVDAIGFSLGSMTLLELACRSPERLSRLVISGVGKTLFDPDQSDVIARAVEGDAAEDDVMSQVFVQYASSPATTGPRWPRVCVGPAPRSPQNGSRRSHALCSWWWASATS